MGPGVPWENTLDTVRIELVIVALPTTPRSIISLEQMSLAHLLLPL